MCWSFQTVMCMTLLPLTEVKCVGVNGQTRQVTVETSQRFVFSGLHPLSLEV